MTKIPRFLVSLGIGFGCHQPKPEPILLKSVEASVVQQDEQPMGQYYYPDWYCVPSARWALFNKGIPNWLQPKESINGKTTKVFGLPGLFDLIRRGRENEQAGVNCFE